MLPLGVKQKSYRGRPKVIFFQAFGNASFGGWAARACAQVYEVPCSAVKAQHTVVLDTGRAIRVTSLMDVPELVATARMARLTLSSTEMESLGRAVEQMLAHFVHMREVNVEGLAPTTHALLTENRLREDVPTTEPNGDALLAGAPERDDRFIVIPNVL
jgi:aspartyl-tRNA(Asn)/glutamyl-tRNA(Gln) amidotransferase subunit C